MVPVLPGSLLILAAVAGLGAVADLPGTGWVVFALVAGLLVVGAVVKYAVPGRRLKAAGVPARTLLLGGLLGLVGFFVVPVVGLFLGFVLGRLPRRGARVGARPGLALDQGRAAGGRPVGADRARRRAAGRRSPGSSAPVA